MNCQSCSPTTHCHVILNILPVGRFQHYTLSALECGEGKSKSKVNLGKISCSFTSSRDMRLWEHSTPPLHMTKSDFFKLQNNNFLLLQTVRAVPRAQNLLKLQKQESIYFPSGLISSAIICYFLMIFLKPILFL